MNKTDRKIILCEVKRRAFTIGYLTAENRTTEIEAAKDRLAVVKGLAYSLGIAYHELTATIEEGWNKGRKEYELYQSALPEPIYRDRETGNTITRAELEREFEILRSESPEEYDYSFSRYVMECTGKNGTLEEITINQK